MIVRGADVEFIREPLLAPFGFKGSHVNELWQTAVRLCSGSDAAVGVGVQSVLWSDARVFRENSASGGNAMMFAMTNYAARLCRGMCFSHPGELLDQLLEPVWEYGRSLTGRRDLRMTFALNALVPLDFAAWRLYAKEQGITSFDDLIPETARSALCFRHGAVGEIPLVSYGMADNAIQQLLDRGNFLLKVKIGHRSAGDTDPWEMLRRDKDRLGLLHRLAENRETPYTKSGKIAYYLDANGMYPDCDFLKRFLDYADHIGVLPQIALLEEPLDEANTADLSGLPVRIVADESAHSVADVLQRIQQGYRAVALKPAAKTLTMTFRMLEAAHRKNIPCFCADLTAPPVTVEWSKNIASRLQPLPGILTGVLETNGAQNYRNWSCMERYHPCAGEAFTRPQGGVFCLADMFYRCSGGVLMDSEYYCSWFAGHQG